MKQEENKGIYLKCKREDCQYKWHYKGKRKFYATCPQCHNMVNINKCKIEVLK